MKKLLIVTLAVLFTAALIPQTAQGYVGVKGGLTFSKFTIAGNTEPLVNLKAPVGGLFFGFKLGPISIQPEVLYARMGGRLEEGADWMEDRFDYIQVPLLLKVNVLPGPISPAIFAGPYGSYLLSAKEVTEIGGASDSVSIKDQVKSTDYGIVFGGGIDFRLAGITLSAEVRYNLGLANIIKNPDPGDYVKNRALMLLAGISF